MKHCYLLFFLSPLFLFAQSYDLAITEIHYHADSSLQSKDWVELYNYGSEVIDLSGWKFKSQNVEDEFIIPEGTLIQPDQYKILVQWADTFSMVYPTVGGLIGDFMFGLSNSGGMVRVFNEIGTPVIQISYGDSLPWPVSADGYGPTLEVDDPTADLNDPNNWFGGCVGGSPGGPYEDCNYVIQLSEINYNSIFYHDSGDWMELVNSGSNAVDLSGWKVRDANDDNQYLIPSGTILEPDEHLVLASTLEQYFTYYPPITNILGDIGFNISGQGDAIRIYNADGILQYAVYYHDDEPWPYDADGEGYTLELLDFFGTPNVPGAWTAGCLYGSPGTAIILPCPTSIEDVAFLPFTFGPNPFTECIHLQFDATGAVHTIRLYDLTGKPVYTQAVQGLQTTLFTGELSAGHYLLSVIGDAGLYQTVVIKP